MPFHAVLTWLDCTPLLSLSPGHFLLSAATNIGEHGFVCLCFTVLPEIWKIAWARYVSLGGPEKIAWAISKWVSHEMGKMCLLLSFLGK
jgi:hypothetical protein